ncbi:class I SAM-dependent methyltransferase [Delftia lacustris]|uniref:Methyltransferase domain-containing protein n=1 Tax=Delftia lacustris TaxID=558537 RepID=A0A1H3F9N4_9BURK|nr:class I SAM-dependent methyltransferase [Delftia lacustris]SDX87682.1 Methyltransferase domain-containing protein [Delftia lacustris]
MNSEIQDHYQGLFKAHGDSAKSVQYTDSPSQFRRFQVLSEISADLGSVVDLGCGLGHFCDYLRSNAFNGSYLGLDFVQEFVDHGNAKYSHDPRTAFQRCDLFLDEFPQGYDTFVVCGVFNNKMSDNSGFMQSVLKKAFAAANRYVAFNAMSTYVDFEASELYYTDPRDVFDFCKRHLTRRVSLRHEYLVRDDRPPFEYTIYLYK